ncbi:RagB/SusD family nutrient uptake outer membrane protein [Pedobacter hartonius]|uniref:Starch-binding associating with outer membrane n=1 Tax=Pedobacter hartonius TaxID=425514 RepID=A0A1H4H7F7_9SPHI|nr:RagB/SusD family nutrient uptake outer membrane protein [Pedobacter hartonius]SEB17724.1 Starch-binding associating with outer membrane [Pedobacter hartonius]
MKLKNTICLLVFFLGSIILPGCKDDLNIIQDSRISSANMWQDEGDIRSAVFGMYDYLRSSFKNNLLYWGEYRNGLWGPGTNNVLHSSDMSAVLSGTMNSTNAYANWSSLYTTINQANLIIKYTNQVTMSQEGKDFALANAYYTRAFCYFWIARIWGDAPLATKGFEDAGDDLYLAKSPQNDLYKQVEADIRSAELSMKPSFTTRTTANPAALAMLKADFGLWMYAVPKAGDSYLTMAETAIQSMALSADRLETDYANIFSAANQSGKEVIFSLFQENGESTGGFAIEHFWNRGYLKPEFINTAVPISENQWWSYNSRYVSLIRSDASDKRIISTYGHGAYGTNGNEIGWPNKYAGQMVSGTRVFDSDIIIYRYAQAFLFDAEIKYYRKNYAAALASLGIITNRAYGKQNYYITTSDAGILNAIVNENLKELAAEGSSWWMLVRTNKIWEYNASLASQISKKNILLWPITQSALNRNNNLKQTEGWQ